MLTTIQVTHVVYGMGQEVPLRKMEKSQQITGPRGPTPTTRRRCRPRETQKAQNNRARPAKHRSTFQLFSAEVNPSPQDPHPHQATGTMPPKQAIHWDPPIPRTTTLDPCHRRHEHRVGWCGSLRRHVGYFRVSRNPQILQLHWGPSQFAIRRLNLSRFSADLMDSGRAFQSFAPSYRILLNPKVVWWTLGTLMFRGLLEEYLPSVLTKISFI